ncbi:hypothetical protein QIX46_08200 [Lysinibacillus boronitolerans]|nr:hypothetical protein QIX46_08200 [Lysinibacillus boronitolerans]
MRRIIEAILCIFVGIFLLGIIAMVFQIIGEDSPNKATIIGGLLSMCGGAIGALAAYLIARMQLTKQLELQDNKDRKRIILEIRLRKGEECLSLINKMQADCNYFMGTWSNIIQDYNLFIERNGLNELDYGTLRNDELIVRVETARDKFISSVRKISVYRPYFNEVIPVVEDLFQSFHSLTENTTNIMRYLVGINQISGTHFMDLHNEIEPLINNASTQFVTTFEILEFSSNLFVEQTQLLIQNFEN